MDPGHCLKGYPVVDARTGLEEEKYPQDIAVFIRYNREVQKLPDRYPMPASMELDQLDDFLREAGHRYKVQWS